MKTYEDLRLCIIDKCQGCEFISYCMYDICISKTEQFDYLATSTALDMLYQL